MTVVSVCHCCRVKYMSASASFWSHALIFHTAVIYSLLATCVLYLSHQMSHGACLAPLNTGSKAVVGSWLDPSLLLSSGRPGILRWPHTLVSFSLLGGEGWGALCLLHEVISGICVPHWCRVKLLWEAFITLHFPWLSLFSVMDFAAPSLLSVLVSLTLPFLLFHAWLLDSLCLPSLHLCLHNSLHHVEASQTFLLCLHALLAARQPLCSTWRGHFWDSCMNCILQIRLSRSCKTGDSPKYSTHHDYCSLEWVRLRRVLTPSGI